MIRFYLSMECHSCEGEMFLGPVATTIIHDGLPVVPYDFASQDHPMTTTDPTDAQPASLDLDDIQARADHYDLLTHQIGSNHSADLTAAATRCADDVPALVAEVRRLRDYAETTRYHQQQHAETFRQLERLRAEAPDLRRERAILHWAADRLTSDVPGHMDTASANERTYIVSSLRRWADELDAEPATDFRWLHVGDLPLWVHACHFAVEAMTDEYRRTEALGGCDACESGSDDPTDWRPLYVPAGPLSTVTPAGTEDGRG